MSKSVLGKIKNVEQEQVKIENIDGRKYETVKINNEVAKYRVEKKPIKTLDDYATKVVKGYNFNPVNERLYSKNTEKPKLVKLLRKDSPLIKAKIPSSYQKVEIVKQLSPAGEADLKIRDLYSE